MAEVVMVEEVEMAVAVIEVIVPARTLKSQPGLNKNSYTAQKEIKIRALSLHQ